MAGLLVAGSARAAMEHEETVLTEDSRLSLSSLLDTAIARQPQVGIWPLLTRPG